MFHWNKVKGLQVEEERFVQLRCVEREREGRLRQDKKIYV